MDRPLAALYAAGIAAYEAGFTALDAYRGLPPAPTRYALVEASLVEAARVFEGLEFPGTEGADAALGPEALARLEKNPPPEPPAPPPRPRHPRDEPGARAAPEPEPATRWVFRLVDRVDARSAAAGWAFAPLALLRDPRDGRFLDPAGCYPSLRAARLEDALGGVDAALPQAALLAARYGRGAPAALPSPPRAFAEAEQRELLELLLTAPEPGRGLELLLEGGFVGAYWPELASLAGVDHAKEHHPEGDAWTHTLETFRYRKVPDFRLSLALLLHDSGKPRAVAAEGRKFDRHAEIGGAVAARLLRRLGFPEPLVADVDYLVRNHMMPAALPRLPWSRTREVARDPRFPLLLELYKCDELSTFRGPENYYEACAAYRRFLKLEGNPYRDAEGRKLARLFLDPSLTP